MFKENRLVYFNEGVPDHLFDEVITEKELVKLRAEVAKADKERLKGYKKWSELKEDDEIYIKSKDFYKMEEAEWPDYKRDLFKDEDPLKVAGHLREALDHLSQLPNVKILYPPIKLGDKYFDTYQYSKTEFLNKLLFNINDYNIDPLEIADILIDRGYASTLDSYIDRFDPEIRPAIFDKLISVGEAPSFLANYPGLDLKYAVKALCELGEASSLAYDVHAVKKFPYDRQLLIQYLIDFGYGEAVTERFRGGVKRHRRYNTDIKEEIVVDQLIEAEDSGYLVENIDNFVDHNYIASKLLNAHQEELLVSHLENFDIFNYQEIALKIIQANKGYLVIDNLKKFKYVDHYKIAMAIVESEGPNQNKNLDSLKLILPELELKPSERERLNDKLNLKGRALNSSPEGEKDIQYKVAESPSGKNRKNIS